MCEYVCVMQEARRQRRPAIPCVEPSHPTSYAPGASPGWSAANRAYHLMLETASAASIMLTIFYWVRELMLQLVTFTTYNMLHGRRPVPASTCISRHARGTGRCLQQQQESTSPAGHHGCRTPRTPAGHHTCATACHVQQQKLCFVCVAVQVADYVPGSGVRVDNPFKHGASAGLLLLDLAVSRAPLVSYHIQVRWPGAKHEHS